MEVKETCFASFCNVHTHCKVGIKPGTQVSDCVCTGGYTRVSYSQVVNIHLLWLRLSANKNELRLIVVDLELIFDHPLPYILYTSLQCSNSRMLSGTIPLSKSQIQLRVVGIAMHCGYVLSDNVEQLTRVARRWKTMIDRCRNPAVNQSRCRTCQKLHRLLQPVGICPTGTNSNAVL